MRHLRAGSPKRQLPEGTTVFQALNQATCCCTTPSSLIRWCSSARGIDPEVLAIKQTIYRTGAKSVLMELLIERRGAARK